MKKLLLLFVLCSSIAHSQWISKTINNGFDEPYRICHTKTVDGAILKLENVDGQIAFYVQGNYTCDDEVTVDLAFLVGAEYKRYSFTSIVNEDHTVVFFTLDFMNSVAVDDFKDCSLVKFRINDTTCESGIYTFNMSGSTAALKYIQQQ